MNLQSYFFLIEERAVAVHNGNIFGNSLSSPYKAIVRADTNETISIVRDSYKIVENEELVKKLMCELIHLNSPFTLDPTHSFVQNEMMRSIDSFPDIKISDINFVLRQAQDALSLKSPYKTSYIFLLPSYIFCLSL